MQFNTLVAFAVTLLIGTTATQAQVYNPIGLPCNSPGTYGCENGVPSINNGNAFVYVCGATGTFQLSALCRGKSTCKVSGGGAYCT